MSFQSLFSVANLPEYFKNRLFFWWIFSFNIYKESADRAIRLTEYFRAMESRIAPEMEVGVLDQRHTELLSLLPSSFTTSEAVGIGKRIGLSESTVKRFLREGAREFIQKEAHGHYCKI